MADDNIIELTADIVSAHVSNNSVSTADLPGLIRSVHAALTQTTQPAEVETPRQEPAVSIRSSVKNDYIVCLEDGAKLKMLKRYLRRNFDMSPDDYRTKWGLPRDYPMVAPAYAETRRALARTIGLGRKKVVEEAATLTTAVKRGAKKAVKAVEDAVMPAKPVRKPRAKKTDAAPATAQAEPTSSEA